ncbi:TRAP transporter small permease [Rhodobacter sp. 24-YEA-8]|uniref:TRAP transporter small permease n=1 Tax=Rhodobacter sp. 24-YEA-8 TaxID=1884310 RepID=UPI0008985F67|nr:TRAP transporter small permease subunit [Rhodobacter sp. 24-YEA-8]SED50684.1 TRAP-type C4-dicarboxylate transport system, small permease component [Rhodobacter sp. 24-YEA-8]
MTHRPGRVARLFAAADSLILNFCAILLVVMCGALLLELVARNLFRHSFIWSMETATICFVWIAFLGGSVAALRKEHFAVDLLSGVVAPGSPVARGLEILGHALFTGLGLLFLVYGWKFAMAGMMRHSFSLGIPQGYTMLIMPLSGALFTISGLWNLFGVVFGERGENA